jgi:hypothetical protein
VLKKTRWCVLKRKANLIHTQRSRLRDLLRYNLKTVRAYLLKEDFQQFWDYDSPAWAAKFLDDWCHQAMRSRIEPMKKIAKTLRAHRESHPQLFPRQKATLQRSGRGPQQQGKTHHEKILRFPHLSRHRNRPVSHSRQITGARNHPQILLTNLKTLASAAPSCSRVFAMAHQNDVKKE